MAAGIRFAAAHGARVINLSLGNAVPGLFQSGDVTSAVAASAHAGAVVVFAAGNSTAPITDSYGTDAFLVAATGPGGSLASYSSRDGSVALAAPGGDDGANGLRSCRPDTCVASTMPGNTYGLLEGTSMAAPHVSGTAALLFAQDPGRDRAAVIDALTATARPLADAGHGLLDADAALRRSPPAVIRPTGGVSGAGPTRDRFVGRTSAAGLPTPPPPASAGSANPGPGGNSGPPESWSGSDPAAASTRSADDQRVQRATASRADEAPWIAATVIVIIVLLGAIATRRTVKN